MFLMVNLMNKLLLFFFSFLLFVDLLYRYSYSLINSNCEDSINSANSSKDSRNAANVNTAETA